MNKFIYPYKSGSQSVKALKEKNEDLKIIKLESSKFKGGKNKLVINWGSTTMPDMGESKVVNSTKAVKIASNKLAFFNTVKDKVSIPEYTEDRDVALEWVKGGEIVLGRTKLIGHSGDGIHIFDQGSVEALRTIQGIKLYVRYVKKKSEYRIHVADGKAVDMQRKSTKLNTVPVNYRVQTHKNGFIFTRDNCHPDQDVIDQAVKAVEVCGLDFGAVDVIWNAFYKKAYVLEVNTAPGLEGSTLDTYSNVFKEVVAKYPQLEDIF